MRRCVEASINRSDSVRKHAAGDRERRALDKHPLGSFHRGVGNRLDHALRPSFQRDLEQPAEEERVGVVEQLPWPTRLRAFHHTRVSVDDWF